MLREQASPAGVVKTAATSFGEGILCRVFVGNGRS